MQPCRGGEGYPDIVDKADAYAVQPLLAESRPEFGHFIRPYHAHRYVVVYRPASDGIEVLRVIHGARDVFKVLRQRKP